MSELIDRQQALDIFDDYNVSVEYGELEAYSRDRKRLCELQSCSEIPNSSDAINRQDAIDALDKRFDNIPMEQTAEILKLRKDLRELPTIQPEPQWIPVSERLPDEHESMFAKYYNTPKWNNSMWLKESDKMFVSVEIPGNEFIVDTAKMIDGKWFFGLSFVDKKVIAWMPLPKPFEGGIK